MSDNDEMYVVKRNGEREIVSFDKILQRIKNTGQEANIQLNYTMLAMKVIDQLYDGISTSQIDELTSEQCASLASTHPDYNILAGRIVVSNLQKNTRDELVKVVNDLYHFKDTHGKHCPIVSEDLYKVVQYHSQRLEEMIYSDLRYTYFEMGGWYWSPYSQHSINGNAYSWNQWNIQRDCSHASCI